MRNLFTRKRFAVLAAGAALVLGAGTALAYFTTTGSGTGSATVGSASWSVTVDAPVAGDYSNGANLDPGTTQVVHIHVENTSGGQQLLSNVVLTGWTSNEAKCDSADNASDFTMSSVAPGVEVAAGATNDYTPTITFNDLNAPQDYCQGASITWTFQAS